MVPVHRVLARGLHGPFVVEVQVAQRVHQLLLRARGRVRVRVRDRVRVRVATWRRKP